MPSLFFFEAKPALTPNLSQAGLNALSQRDGLGSANVEGSKREQLDKINRRTSRVFLGISRVF